MIPNTSIVREQVYAHQGRGAAVSAHRIEVRRDTASEFDVFIDGRFSRRCILRAIDAPRIDHELYRAGVDAAASRGWIDMMGRHAPGLVIEIVRA